MRSETDFHNYRNSSVLFELWANYGNYGNLFSPPVEDSNSKESRRRSDSACYGTQKRGIGASFVAPRYRWNRKRWSENWQVTRP